MTLAMLIDRPVEIGPLASDLQVGLVDEPPVTQSVPTRPRSLDELRGEALHPPVDGHVINSDTALGQQFLDISRTGHTASTSGPRPRSSPAGTGNQRRPRSYEARSPDQSPASPIGQRKRAPCTPSPSAECAVTATLAYAQRRRTEGKTDREIRRCIKRYLARYLYLTLSIG